MTNALRTLAIIILCIATLGLVVPSAFAQDAPAADAPTQPPWFANSIKSFSDTLLNAQNDGSVQKEGYDTATQMNLEAGLVCQTVGCSDNPGHTFYYGKSAVASMGNVIAMMYKYQPADFGLWLADTGRTLGFIPPQVSAQQGIGFTGLSELLPLWKVFRNIAYLLLALVMIVIGFMVMFRKKIDPKTVVTVQNALPRIVIALLLITFSYAIVGLMIDLMYLAILFVTAMIKTTGYLPTNAGFPFNLKYHNIEEVMSTGGLFAMNSTLFQWGMFSITDLAADILGWNWAAGIAAGVASGGIAALLNPVAGIVTGAVVAGLPVIFALLIALALVFTYIRLFFMFLNAYINIILALLIAPLQLLFEAVPGSTAFSSWFKNLLSNIAVFPVAAVMFLIAMFFSTAADKVTGAIWTPPYATIPSGSARSVAALFSLGILMTIPQVVASIKEALKAKSPVSAGPGAVFAPITGAYQTGVGALNQFYYAGMSTQMLGGLFKPKTPAAPGSSHSS